MSIIRLDRTIETEDPLVASCIRLIFWDLTHNNTVKEVSLLDMGKAGVRLTFLNPVMSFFFLQSLNRMLTTITVKDETNTTDTSLIEHSPNVKDPHIFYVNGKKITNYYAIWTPSEDSNESFFAS